jgi:hypothetical protein
MWFTSVGNSGEVWKGEWRGGVVAISKHTNYKSDVSKNGFCAPLLLEKLN